MTIAQHTLNPDTLEERIHFDENWVDVSQYSNDEIRDLLTRRGVTHLDHQICDNPERVTVDEFMDMLPDHS